MKLTFKKQTIANLDAQEMKNANGGAITHYSVELTNCPSCHSVCQPVIDEDQ
jgi:DNA-binding helix-hairpin-helix protein with protein kinase domain